MMGALAAVRLALSAFVGDPLGHIWKWICHRSFWQLVSLGLGALFIVQHFQLVSARHSAAKWESQTSKLQTQLDTETEKSKAAEKQTAQISKQLRDRTDEKNRRIAGDADTLRLRGPGKAVCPPVSSSPGEHKQAAPDTNVAGPSLPTDERAAVPWDWLVQRAQEHDELLNEVQAWRDWHEQVLKVWPKTTEARP